MSIYLFSLFHPFMKHLLSTNFAIETILGVDHLLSWNEIGNTKTHTAFVLVDFMAQQGRVGVLAGSSSTKRQMINGLVKLKKTK